MKDEELRSKPFPKIWDNTMKELVWVCPRKFYWFMRGYDYATRPPYFTWGSAWQEILVSWYDKNPYSPDEQEYWTRSIEALAAGFAYYDKHIGAAEPNTDNSRENLEAIWANYLQEHPTESWELVPGGGEVGWVYPIKGTDFFLAGSLDGYIKWEPYGYLVLENKSTSEYLSDGYIARWDFAPQITGYVWYLDQIQEEVFGALMNLVTKKRPGPKSQWKTPRTTRSLVKKNLDDLAEFREQSLWTIELAQTYWRNWFWPKTQDATNCTGGAGKAPCLFKNVCRVKGIPFTEFEPFTTQGITLRKGPWEPWTRNANQEESE